MIAALLPLACLSPEPPGTDPVVESPPPDTGETGTDPAQFVLTAGAAVVCADPGARADAPITRAAFGEEWDAAATMREGHEVHGGVTVADLTGDGRLDIYVPDVDGERLFVADSAGNLHEESDARLPTSQVGTVVHGSPADVDGDGDLDLFVTRVDGANQLLRNDGTGVFADVTEAAGFITPDLRSSGSAWGDMDGDGDLDLVVTAHRDCEEDVDAPKDGVLWENLGDGTFEDATSRLPLGTMPPLQGRTPAFLDADDDGDEDLYFVVDVGNAACNNGDLLFLNEGGAFVDAGPETGANLRGEGMGLGVGDLNGDLLPDLVVSDAGRIDVLESLTPGAWYMSTPTRGLQLDPEAEQRFDAWGLELADLDDDGDLDLPAVFGDIPNVDTPVNYPDQRDAIFLQGEDGIFSDAGPAWGFDDPRSMRGLVVFDLDGDGWLDLVRREIWGAAEAWMQRCGDAHWIEIDLRAPAPNTFAIGAVVDVTAGEVTWRRWVHAGGTSLYSSAPSTVHVGLGEVTTVDVRVRWPDGVESEHLGVAADRRVEIRRGW